MFGIKINKNYEITTRLFNYFSFLGICSDSSIVSSELPLVSFKNAIKIPLKTLEIANIIIHP